MRESERFTLNKALTENLLEGRQERNKITSSNTVEASADLVVQRPQGGLHQQTLPTSRCGIGAFAEDYPLPSQSEIENDDNPSRRPPLLAIEQLSNRAAEGDGQLRRFLAAPYSAVEEP